MSKFRKVSIFRTFSANDWNKPESGSHIRFIFPTLYSESKSAPNFSSNAEKMRKTDSQSIKEN